MIGLSWRVKVHALGRPADLRAGFEGLSALVRNEMKRDPLSGDLYLFTNRARHRAKTLMWDGTGLCVFAKRLEKGRFACLWRDPGRRELELTVSELTLFLEGSELVGRMKLSPNAITENDLAVAIPI